MSKGISKQLKDQGFNPPSNVKKLQRIADSILDLYVFGILTPSQVDIARRKLLKMIVESMNKEKV